MNINEFAEKYYFHDSSIEEIKYEAEHKKLIVVVDSCCWFKNFYEKDTLVSGKISVVFENVSLFEYEQHDFKNNLENLDTEVDHMELNGDGILKIFIWEYFFNEDKEETFWWIKIKADNVEVTELERYNS